MIAGLSAHARRGSLLFAALVALAVALVVSAAPAFGEAQPWWRLQSRPAPSNMPPQQEALIVLTATNMGDKPTKGPITITDTIPAGLNVTYAHGNNSLVNQTIAEGQPGVMKCSPNTFPTAPPFAYTEKITCTFSESLREYEALEVSIRVHVEEPEGTVKSLAENSATVEGGNEGGEPPAAVTATSLTAVNPAPTPFGVENKSSHGAGYEIAPENEGGTLDRQAGSHPFQLTTPLNLAQSAEPKSLEARKMLPSAPALFKDVQVKLPPGLVGNASSKAIPRCTDFQFSSELGAANLCPANTAVGVAEVAINEPFTAGYKNQPVPVFNLVPAPGEPARFGFDIFKVPVIFDTAVRTGQDYSVVVSVRNASQSAQVLGSQVTFWGNPGDPVHDHARGWACLAGGQVGGPAVGSCQEPNPRPTEAFLSLPTSCPSQGSESLKSTAQIDSWLEPGVFKTAEAELPAPENCGALPFAPELQEVRPDTEAGNTPTGLTVVVKVPQQSTLEEKGLSEAAVRATSVTLPPGMLLSPSAANGLEACTPGETEFINQFAHGGIGFLGNAEFEPGAPTPTFTPQLPADLKPGVNFCPDGSKVGTVKIKSPDLDHELEGGVFLAAQYANPFGSLLAMYIVAEDPVSHVLAKLAGEVHPDPVTGQVTSTFNNTPQVPFETLTLTLFGGPRASVTTPPRCGSYATASTFTPWSGTGPVSPPQPSFNISSGADATGCASPRPLAPGFDAHSTNTQAGGFTGFEVTLTRPDSNQAATALDMTLPPGLAAILKNVSLCGEQQANEGTCGGASLIGKVIATAGLGADPFTAGEGHVYITGPYHGAPFGLSVVIPTQAGPFNFGNVVTRSTLSVNPYTAQVTIGSPIPTMVTTTTTASGVPAQLKQLHVVVDRPNFQFNPTNCNPLKITGALTGDEGGSAPLNSGFQVGNCTMPFKPVLTAETEAKTSKLEGAALVVKVESTGLGVEQIAKTKVALPIALPSRLTTIQKACLAKVFEANPESGCPEGSNIGTAIIYTPVFAHPLKGPAFLVSHGNEAFPDVEFVLKGEGVTIILDGKTDIKNGITTSSFETLPDAPFTKFETILPRGPHSALTANGDLCKQSLIMPTTITAQNGSVIKQETKIKVNGCGGVAGSRESSLAKALKKCRKKFKHNRRKRIACERAAKKKYGPKKHKKH